MSDEHLPAAFRRNLTLAKSDAGEAQDDDAQIPEPGADYKAFITGRNSRVEQSLHVMLPSGAVRSFRYSQLDGNGEFDESGRWFKLRFLCMKPVEVTVHGRNLRRGYDLLFSERVHCVMVSASQFDPDDGRPYVSRVDVVPLEVEGDAKVGRSTPGLPGSDL